MSRDSKPAPEIDAPPRDRKVLIGCLMGLAAFLAWQALALKNHMGTDTRPPAWDQAIHLEIALDYKEAMKDGRIFDIFNLAPKSGMPPFPPMYHLGIAFAYDRADPSSAILSVHWFYITLLCIALFGIVLEFRPPPAALAAVLIFICTPVIQALYRTQLIDLSVAAWTTAGYWAVFRSDKFRKWPGAICFGVIYAVGMLHKWSFFSYMFPACFDETIERRIFDAGQRDGRDGPAAPVEFQKSGDVQSV